MAARLFIRNAGPIGAGISSLEIWFLWYKSMDDLRYAPSYIDGNGNPVYDNKDFEDPFNANYSW